MSIDIRPIRKTGFYWVKRKGLPFEVGVYNSSNKTWGLCGLYQELTDNSFVEIDEDRLKRQIYPTMGNLMGWKL